MKYSKIKIINENTIVINYKIVNGLIIPKLATINYSIDKYDKKCNFNLI